jgi:fructose-1,6-bisphosphatase/inositol monophosphatase family enzyme
MSRSITSVSSLVPFATDLLEPAFDKLKAGYDELVDRLQSNSELADLVAERGIDGTVTSDHPMVTALQKRNKEFVTQAEQQAESVMRERVLAHYPDHSVTGEELGSVKGDDWLWVFDPVDGTSAMIRTAIAHAYAVELPSPLPAFGITIAVVHGNDAALGVVAELRRGDDGLVMPNIWIGAQDHPTTRNGDPVALSPVNSLENATLASTVPEVMFTTRESWSGFQALLDSTAAFLPDQNCIGFMRILDGTVDVVMESDLTLPDSAALIPTLVGAGITVTDPAGQPVRFDAAARAGEYSLLAAPPILHQQALAAVRRGVPDSENRFARGETVHQGYSKKFPSANATQG